MRVRYGMVFVAAFATMCCMAAHGADFWAEAKARTVPRTFEGAGGKVLRYRIAEKIPEDGSKVPLVLFLHGAGERGTNNVSQLRHGVGELVCWLDEHEKGYRVIAGQVPNGKRWVEVDWGAKSHDMPKEPSETMALLMEFLDRQLLDPAVDLSRVYVTGISMGGYGTWDLLCRRPEVFAAAMPVCGGGDVSQAAKIAKVPLWVFHGGSDSVVPVCRSRNMVSALWQCDGNVRYKEYPGVDHNCWTPTYADQDVLKWFFAQRKKPGRIDEIMAKMTLREKIGQCVNISIADIPLGSEEETAAWFAKYPVGSVFMGKDLASYTKERPGNKAALARCAAATKIPLSVAGDLGPVTAPAPLPGYGSIGAVDDLKVAREYGRFVGRLGRANGYNWVFAPCVDLAINWLNPIMACRTMGDNADKVAALSVEIAKGMQEYGLSASAKHFPGDGVDHRDQHLGPCINSFTREKWSEAYGKVYRSLAEADCHAVMIGHISLPFADPPKGKYGLPPPAVMSAPISCGILRNEIGFKGVAVTDALMMGGFVIYKFDPEERRYLEAFKAGADVLLWPRLGVFELMEKAVESGEIPMERLDASVRRVLEMKEKEGLFDHAFRTPKGPDAALVAEAEAFTRKVTEREVALVRNDAGLLPLDRAKTKKILMWIADGSGKKTLSSYDAMKREFEKRGAEVTVAINGNCLDFWKREAAGERYDAVFFVFASRMHMIPNAIRPIGGAGECLSTMINTDFHKPIAISYAYPFLLQDAPWLETLVNVHVDEANPSDVVQETVVSLLYGEKPFVGKSPFDLSVDLGVQK